MYIYIHITGAWVSHTKWWETQRPFPNHLGCGRGLIGVSTARGEDKFVYFNLPFSQFPEGKFVILLLYQKRQVD